MKTICTFALVFLGYIFLITVQYNVRTGTGTGTDAGVSTADTINGSEAIKSAVNPSRYRYRYRYRRDAYDDDEETPPAPNPKTDTMTEILKLLEEGNKQIQLNTTATAQHGDIILMVGNTGAGKTTMTHLVAGDDSQLYAYYADEETILIKDNEKRISSSTIISKSIFPHLYVDRGSNTAFYDCPGFSDTRNTTVEIGNSFFLKKVADSATRVKVGLIVNHRSLTPGEDRLDFMLLLKHTTAFLRNMAKFRNSVALIATKVKSTQGDHIIIRNIANFLNTTKLDLGALLKGPQLLKARQLIDALLTRDEEGLFNRLAIFKQPTEPGPLSTMTTVQAQKSHIKRTILNNIQFIVTDPEQDFGLSLSDKAKLETRNLTNAVRDQMTRDFLELTRELKTHFSEKMTNPLPSGSGSGSGLEQLRADLEIFKNNAELFLQNMTTVSASASTGRITYKLLSSFINQLQFQSLDLDCHGDGHSCVPPSILESIKHNGEYLDFLQSVTQAKITRNPQQQERGRGRDRWLQPLQEFLSFLNEKENYLCLQLETDALNTIHDISSNIGNYFIDNFKNLEHLQGDNFRESLRHLLNMLQNMENVNSPMPSDLVQETIRMTHELNSTISNQTIQSTLIQTGRFLDKCKNKKNSQEATVLEFLSRFTSFVSPVKSNFDIIEDVIYSKILGILENITESFADHYRSRYDSNGSSNSEMLKDLLDNDLYHFYDISDSILQIENSDSTTTKSRFLPGISEKICHYLEMEQLSNPSFGTETHQNQQLNRLVMEDLAFLREFMTGGNRENTEFLEKSLMNPLALLVKSVEDTFWKFFHRQDATMLGLLAKASSQLKYFYLDAFRQLSYHHTDEFVDPITNITREVSLLLTSLKETEDLVEINDERRSPSHFLRHVMRPYLEKQEASPTVPIFQSKLTNDLDTTAQILDFFAIFNTSRSNIFLKTTITTTNNVSITNQTVWLHTFQAFVTDTKSSFKMVSDEVHFRIRRANQELTEVMASAYALKFEQLFSFSTNSNNTGPGPRRYLLNLKESIEQDLDLYQGILDDLNNSQAVLNTSGTSSVSVPVFLTSAAKNFTQPLRLELNPNKTEGIFQQLTDLGQCADFIRKYPGTSTALGTQSPEESYWFNPFSAFVNSLNETINGPITCTDISGKHRSTVVIHGTFVRVSQVLSSNMTWCISETTETLIILSLHTLYLDTDIIGSKLQENGAKTLNIAIIAPHWIVQDQRIVNLNGLPGKNHTMSKAGQSSKGIGRHGLPGLPGGNAGNFLGVGLTLIQNVTKNTHDISSTKTETETGTETEEPSRLSPFIQVWASGGEGGAGQEGGDGLHGTNGENVTLDKIQYTSNGSSAFTTKTTLIKIEPYELVESGVDCHMVINIYQCSRYTLAGTLGTRGKNGGWGGVGGKGGHRGLITVRGPSNFESQFNYSNNNASQKNRDDGRAPAGPSALGGQGGNGGVHGHFALVKIAPENAGDGYVNGMKIEETHPKGVAESGIHGRNHSYKLNIIHPQNQTYSLNEQLSAIIVFRSFARRPMQESSLSLFTKTNIQQFLDQIDETEISQINNASLLSFIEEFLDLETEYFKVAQPKTSHFSRFYEHFARKINRCLQQFASTKESETSTETKNVLTYIYTAVTSRINALDTNYKSNLVTDMSTYLQLAMTNLRSFKKKSANWKALALISNVTQGYTSEIQKEIATVQDFLRNEISPEMSRLQNELDRGVGRLLDEIISLKLEISGDELNLTKTRELLLDGISHSTDTRKTQETLNTNQALLAKKKSQLKTKLIVNNVLNIISIGSKFLRYFGPIAPVGIITAEVIGQTTASVGRIARLALGDGIEPGKGWYSEMYKQIAKEFILNSRMELTGFSTFLNDTKIKVMTADPAAFENVIRTINEISSKVETELLTYSQYSQLVHSDQQQQLPKVILGSSHFIHGHSARLHHAVKFTQELLTVSLNNTNTNALKVTQKNNVTENSSKTERNIGILSKICNTLQLSPEFYQKIRNDQNKIDQVTEEIKGSQERIKELEEFSLRVENGMSSILLEFHSHSKMFSDSDSAVENQTLEPPAIVDVTRWHVARLIRDVKSLVKNQFTRNYKLDDDVTWTFQKLDEGFRMVTQVHERIANYHRELKLANFIANINSRSLAVVQIRDPLVRDRIQRLELVIISNVIMNQHNLILHSLKMGKFPFADHYLQNLKLTEKVEQIRTELLRSGNSTGLNYSDLIQELAETASDDIQRIRTKFVTSESTHKNLDNYETNAAFYRSKSTVPFYVWEHGKFGYVIRKLLSGQSVVLKADICKSPTNNYGYGAVKFSTVNINFRAADVNKDGDFNPGALLAREGLLAELNSELENYRIKMTHLGNSEYSYDGKYYSIPSPPITFTFTFQKTSSGLPSTRNVGYDKISAGDVLLSPYALWKIHIAPVDSIRNFTVLQTLANSDDFQFNLELIGNGTYVENGSGSRLKIREYYQVDDSIQAPAP